MLMIQFRRQLKFKNEFKLKSKCHKDLPSPSEMKKCTKLKVLNLHNNGIHHVESLLALSVIPNLIALTLYNCPIYKRTGYRHHTVNTMWSIKVSSTRKLMDRKHLSKDSEEASEGFSK